MKNIVFIVALFVATRAFLKSSKFNEILTIVGGREASPHQFPYQIGIYVNKSTGREFCGGSLVSTDYVLTAAHCADNAQIIELILGAHNITDQEPTQLRLTSKKFVIHPDYNWTKKKADLALVKLPQPVQENDFIKIISIANGNETFEGQKGTFTGWGLMSLDQPGVTPLLHYVYADIISNAECKKAGGSFTPAINPTLMCTSGSSDQGPVGSGLGDSGGPLVVNKVQVGVISFASRHFNDGEPTAFVRLTEYKDWFREYLVVNS